MAYNIGKGGKADAQAAKVQKSGAVSRGYLL